MNKYQCHKIVDAFKITSMESTVNGWILNNLETGDTIPVSSHWMATNHATVGGYLVRHPIGYSYYSSAAQFEARYTKL